MKFKIGDRVIVDGKSGTIIGYDTQFGSSEVLFYRIKFEDKLRLRWCYISSRYFLAEAIQFDVARVRDEKLKDIL